MRNRGLSIIRWFPAVLGLILLHYSCRENEPPLLITAGVDYVTHNAATGGGSIIDDGGREVSHRGVVWGATPLPDLEDHAGSNNSLSQGLYNRHGAFFRQAHGQRGRQLNLPRHGIEHI